MKKLLTPTNGEANGKAKIVSSNQGRILARLGRLTLTGVITFSIGAAAIFERYNNYWEKTIFRVQTVDFNILSHTLPTKLSYTIIQNKPEELQRTLNSNYSLFGLVITDPTGQKIIASSQSRFSSRSWSVALNPQQLQKHPYDLLLDPPPLYPQWSYSDPRAVERSATNFTNQGRVIGRVYYVRGVRPSFKNDFLQWLVNPLAASSRAEMYTMTMLACLTSSLAFWGLWEYLLYKKYTQKLQAQQKEKELIDKNSILSCQLTERVNEIEKLRHQIELEHSNSFSQAEQYQNYNQQLQQEIAQLHNTIAVLPSVTSSNRTQIQLSKAQEEIKLAHQEQQEQKQQIHQLNQQLQVYHNQLLEAKGASKKQFENRIKETEKARALAEIDLEKIRNSEKTLREKTSTLERHLTSQQSVQNQLTRQLEILQKTLAESQRQEQESHEKAERASQHLESLAQELELLKEETGRHSLNKFEKYVFTQLQNQLTNKEIHTQFDVGIGGENSKFVDFLVILNNCIIVVEAKSYIGAIEPINDPRNKHWICRTGNNNIRINNSWGVNPYQQVKVYVDAVLFRTQKHISRIHNTKVPVYGIVVFPSETKISNSIQTEIGEYYRFITLSNLIRTINEIQNQVTSRNLSRMTYGQIDAIIAA